MKLRIFTISTGIVLLLSLAACERKEFPAAPPPPPAPENISAPEESEPLQEITMKTILPESIKKAWGSVKLQLTDKETWKADTLTIAIGTDYSLPDTDIRISVGDFLPDYKMDGLTITSWSDKALNPAVNITIYAGEKKLFNGWLFSAHPSINAFQHDRYGLKLLKGVRTAGK